MSRHDDDTPQSAGDAWSLAASRWVEIRHHSAAGTVSVERRRVVSELPLQIEITEGASYSVICTPGDELALATGFLFAEGIIERASDIAEIWPMASGTGVRVRLIEGKPTAGAGRNLLITSSCGLCGRAEINELLSTLRPCDAPMSVAMAALLQLPARVRQTQRLFDETGGTHAAALFGADGDPTIVAEDIGRHSALDKVIGKALRSNHPLRGQGIFLSGRTSLEMVLKAARAGAALVVSVSAASATAIDVADRLGITLCGFSRGKDVTVYTHPQRIR